MTVLVRIALVTGVPRRGRERSSRSSRRCAVTGLAAVALAGDWDVAGRGRSCSRACSRPGSRRSSSRSRSVTPGASRTSVTVGTAPLFAVATRARLPRRAARRRAHRRRGADRHRRHRARERRARPEHFERIGLVSRSIGTLAFAMRDKLVRWLGRRHRRRARTLAIRARCSPAAAVSLALLVLDATPLTRRAARRFVPAESASASRTSACSRRSPAAVCPSSRRSSRPSRCGASTLSARSSAGGARRARLVPAPRSSSPAASDRDRPGRRAGGSSRARSWSSAVPC